MVRGEAPASLAAAFDLDLSRFGTGSRTDRATWTSVVRQMRADGLLVTDYVAKGALSLSATGEALGTGGASVSFRASTVRRPTSAVVAAPARPPTPDMDDVPPPPPEMADDGEAAEPVRRTFKPGLLKALRAERDAIARRNGVSPSMVLTDDEVRTVSVARPRTRSDMVGIAGMNARKLDRYATLFLNVIERFAPPPVPEEDVDAPGL